MEWHLQTIADFNGSDCFQIFANIWSSIPSADLVVRQHFPANQSVAGWSLLPGLEQSVQLSVDAESFLSPLVNC